MNEILKQITPMVEALVKKAIEDNLEKVLSAQLDKLKQVIPGVIDDAIIEGAKPELIKAGKEALLKLADKISAEV